MKKHFSPKLQLHRETLRNLSELDLRAAAGGDTGTTCHTATEAATCTNSGCPSNWTGCC